MAFHIYDPGRYDDISMGLWAVYLLEAASGFEPREKLFHVAKIYNEML